MTAAAMIVFFTGCSGGGKEEASTGEKEHFLKGQVGAMRDAEAVKRTLDLKTGKQDETAAALTGH